jgi:hypothetical protein
MAGYSTFENGLGLVIELAWFVFVFADECVEVVLYDDDLWLEFLFDEGVYYWIFAVGIYALYFFEDF